MKSTQTPATGRTSKIFLLLKQSLQGENLDFTTGSIRRAVLLLAIPMMLEMAMESVFALVDLYFVGHLHRSSYAIQTVGLTESVLSIIYSLAIGMSMAATAVVARRVGEKDPVAAAKAGRGVKASAPSPVARRAAKTAGLTAIQRVIRLVPRAARLRHPPGRPS